MWIRPRTVSRAKKQPSVVLPRWWKLEIILTMKNLKPTKVWFAAQAPVAKIVRRTRKFPIQGFQG